MISASTVVKDVDAQAALPGFQTQVSRDFAPMWGIDSTLMSCFELSSQAAVKFDHGGNVSRTLKLLSGGYIGVLDVTAGTGRHQITSERSPPRYSMRPR